MSGHLYAECWSLVLSHDERAILQALADNAKQDGTHCFPSVAYLAWMTDYSERQVQRTLKGLRDGGIIEATEYATGGRSRPTEYTIHLDRAPRKVPWREVRAARKGDIGVGRAPAKRVTPESQLTLLKGDIGVANIARKRVTNDAQKGDIFGAETAKRVTNSAQKGDIGVTRSYVDPGYEDPGTGSVSRGRAREASKHDREVADEFVAEMTALYGAKLGGENGVREQLSDALNHRASDRWKDKRRGLRGWLRRAAAWAERDAAKGGGRARPAAGGVRSPTKSDAEIADDQDYWNRQMEAADRLARGLAT